MINCHVLKHGIIVWNVQNDTDTLPKNDCDVTGTALVQTVIVRWLQQMVIQLYFGIFHGTKW